MQIVRRRDVDDLHGGICENVVQGVVGARDAKRLGAQRAAFRGAAKDPADLHADSAQGFHVDRADEARTDDGRADVGDPPHASFTYLGATPRTV